MAKEVFQLDFKDYVRFEQTLKDIGRQAGLTEKDVDDLGKEFRAAGKEAEGFGDGVGKSKQQLKGLDGVANNIGRQFAALFAVEKVVQFGTAVFDTTKKFESLRALLTNTLGSQSAGEQAFARIQQFAATTPFQVDEITDSFVRLASSGFKPTNAELTKLGDLAAARGKTFKDLAEGILDAEQFEFERLKEFGILSRQNGDQIRFTFRGVTQTVDKSAESVRNYILSLGDLNGIQGQTAAVSKTLEGQVSNLSDKYDRFLDIIGQKSRPAFEAGIQGTSSLLDGLTALAQFDFDIIPFAGIATFAPSEENIQKLRELGRQEKTTKAIEDLTSGFKGLKTSIEIEAEIDRLNEKLRESQSESGQAGMKVFELRKQLAAQQDVDFGSAEVDRLTRQLRDALAESDAATVQTDAYRLALGELEEKLGTVNNKALNENQKALAASAEELKKLQEELDKFNTKVESSLFADVSQISSGAEDLVDEALAPFQTFEDKLNEIVSEGLEGADEAFNLDEENEKIELALAKRLISQEEYLEQKLANLQAAQASEIEIAEAENELYALKGEQVQAQKDLELEAFQQSIGIASGLAGLFGEQGEAIGKLLNFASQAAQKFVQLSKIQAAASQKAAAADGQRAIANAAAVPFPANIIAIGTVISLITSSLATVKGLFGENRFAKGVRRLKGPGSETSDSIPSLLSRNERVTTAEVNNRYYDDLNAIEDLRPRPGLVREAILREKNRNNSELVKLMPSPSTGKRQAPVNVKVDTKPLAKIVGKKNLHVSADEGSFIKIVNKKQARKKRLQKRFNI